MITLNRFHTKPNSNGYIYVFDVKQHDWTDLYTAICRGAWEIKNGGLEPELIDWLLYGTSAQKGY